MRIVPTSLRNRLRAGLLTRFAIAGLVAVVLLGVVLVRTLSSEIRGRSLADARQEAQLIDDTIVQPKLSTHQSPERSIPYRGVPLPRAGAFIDTRPRNAPWTSAVAARLTPNTARPTQNRWTWPSVTVETTEPSLPTRRIIPMVARKTQATAVNMINAVAR